MAHIVNPNTNIPMSLQVERMQQLQNLHDLQQQGQLAQKSSLEKQLEQQRVNANKETAGAMIRDSKDKDSTGRQKKNDKGAEDQSKQEDEKQLGFDSFEKGRIIDVSV